MFNYKKIRCGLVVLFSALALCACCERQKGKGEDVEAKEKRILLEKAFSFHLSNDGVSSVGDLIGDAGSFPVKITDASTQSEDIYIISVAGFSVNGSMNIRQLNSTLTFMITDILKSAGKPWDLLAEKHKTEIEVWSNNVINDAMKSKRALKSAKFDSAEGSRQPR